VKENPSTPSAVSAPAPVSPEAEGWSRHNPFAGTVVRSVRLNGPESEKETRHVEIALDDGPTYEVGDSLGVYPENSGGLVAAILSALNASGEERVPAGDHGETSLRDALTRQFDLSDITDELLGLLAQSATDTEEADRLRDLAGESESIEGFDILDVLQAFSSARPAPAELVATLALLRPRLYSIASSPKRHAGQVHLAVRRVSYEFRDRTRDGVASTMLADRVEAGTRVRVFVQPSHGFRLPDQPDAALIMIGPGTGIAPFRAFLHERDALEHSGKNWLFFGDQRSTCDFLYRDELADFFRRGVLSRLDAAFSRDQSEKVYVQHRIVEQGADVYRWIRDGAFVYVCGDAKRMAADVDRALRAVIREHGEMSDETAAAYVSQLAASGRYRRDVY
jgi:sulfite reductase (NADPH) flavoprotein alpha-component